MQDQKIYIIKEVKLELEDRIVTVEALVHELGLKRVFEEANLPKGLGDLVGKNCVVLFENFKLKGRFSREATPLGIFYNLRFLHISDADKDRIKREIKEKGLPAPWNRKFVRISTNTKDGDLPVPFLAVGKGKILNGLFFNVVNFTLGGVLLETPEEDGFFPKLNQEVQFDLITNTGEKIENMSGLIMHVNEDIDEKNGTRNVTFGVRMMPMSLINEVKYNGLIRDFLVGYKRKMRIR